MKPAFDLVIRNGTVVDGTGSEPRPADIGICDGRIAQMGRIGQRGREEIDARHAMVTPGFVDIHTHYDGQATWSTQLAPSSAHGVTTVITGNCGVGFAPCRVADRSALINVMEGVEDIPESVMEAGVRWDWESFPDYLDALGRRPHDVDIGAMLPHSPLRIFAMGERGMQREAATEEDLNRMRAIAAEALRAGALGIATSRSVRHRTGDGRGIPTHDASQSELEALGAVLQEEGTGVFQLAPNVSGASMQEELDVVTRLAGATGAPVTFSLPQLNDRPDDYRYALGELERINRLPGVVVSAQVLPRPIGVLLGHATSTNPFHLCASYAALEPLPLNERVRHLKSPELRQRLIGETPTATENRLYSLGRRFERIFPLRDPPNYEPKEEDSIAAMARRLGKQPEEVAYDLLLEDDGRAMLFHAMSNYSRFNLDDVWTLLNHPHTVVGLGDGGAHYGLICDASYPTFMLTHWVRDRPGKRLSLPHVVHALSARPARVFGLRDRGVLAVGYKADLNVIDFDKLTLHAPYADHGLPGGGRRILQRASGYRATVVSGQLTYEAGVFTGAAPGTLIRGVKPAPVRH